MTKLHPQSGQDKQYEGLNTRRLSLYLAVQIGLGSLLVALVTTLFQLYITYQYEVSNSAIRADELSVRELPSLTASLWEENQGRIERILDRMITNPYIGDILLIDEYGERKQRHAARGATVYTRTLPIRYEQEGESFPLGELRLTFTDEAIIQSLGQRLVSISATSFLTIFFAATFSLLLFNRLVTRRIEKMARYTHLLNLKNIDKPLVVSPSSQSYRDELDLVADAINDMRSRLVQELAIQHQYEQELLNHRDNLEQLVKERTRDLEQKNALLEQQSQALESQNRELDAYAHSVAHDLKTPLTTLLGMARLLTAGKDKFSERQLEESLQMILRTARKMNDIIGALLLLASVRRNQRVELAPLDMNYLVNEAWSRLLNSARDRQTELQLTGNLPMALGQTQWIEEVWVNFLSNAIKYGGDRPQLEIGAEPIAGQRIKYWVRDFGPGVPLAKQQNLFIEFSRLEPTRTEGHGLGLSIVKRIVERLGGEVGYSDAKGGGSCFWFILPAAPDSEPEERAS